MQNNITKKQHYVPQFYLKNFTDNNGFIYVYDRETKKHFKSTPKDICREDYLYEVKWKDAHPTIMKKEYILINQIENYLSKNESKFNALIKKIIDICNNEENENALLLNSDEKKILRSFVANMYARNPIVMEDIFNFNNNDKDLKENKLADIREILEQMKFGGFESFFKYSIMRGAIEECAGFGLAYDIVQDMQKLTFTIYKSSGTKFITSSMPVRMRDEKTGNYIAMPLSPDYLVMFSNNPLTFQTRNSLIQVDNSIVDDYNRQLFNTYPQCIKYLISNKKDELIRLVKIAKAKQLD